MEALPPPGTASSHFQSGMAHHKDLRVSLGALEEGGSRGSTSPQQRLTSPLRTSPLVNQPPFIPSTHKAHQEVFTRDPSPCVSPATSPTRSTHRRRGPSAFPEQGLGLTSPMVSSPGLQARASIGSVSNGDLHKQRLSLSSSSSASPERRMPASMKHRYTNTNTPEHLREHPHPYSNVASPTAASFKSAVLKETVVPLPPVLAFESWWNEGKERIHVAIDFESATGVCTASLNVAALTHRGPACGQTPIEPWDLHVGAQVHLLGRRMRLHKARDAATLQWLGAQAFLLRRVKEAFEQQLAKFRLVGSYARCRGERCEVIDPVCHSSTPVGGRANLRNLRNDIVDLATMLREHQLGTAPTSSSTGRSTGLPHLLQPLYSEPGSPSSASPPGSAAGRFSQTWSPGRWQREDQYSEEKRRSSMHESQRGSRAEELRRDFMSWIVNIPLAASAARLEKQGNQYLDPSANANSKHVHSKLSAGRLDDTARASSPKSSDTMRRGSTLALDLGMFAARSNSHGANGEKRGEEGPLSREQPRAAKASLQGSTKNQAGRSSPQIPQPSPQPIARTYSNTSAMPSRPGSRRSSSCQPNSAAAAAAAAQAAGAASGRDMSGFLASRRQQQQHTQKQQHTQLPRSQAGTPPRPTAAERPQSRGSPLGATRGGAGAAGREHEQQHSVAFGSAPERPRSQGSPLGLSARLGVSAQAQPPGVGAQCEQEAGERPPREQGSGRSQEPQEDVQPEEATQPEEGTQAQEHEPQVQPPQEQGSGHTQEPQKETQPEEDAQPQQDTQECVGQEQEAQERGNTRTLEKQDELPELRTGTGLREGAVQ